MRHLSDVKNIKQLQETANKSIVSIFNKYIAKGYNDDLLVGITQEDLIKLISILEPKSLREIKTICNALSVYARNTNNGEAYNVIKNLNKQELFENIKGTVPEIYISYEQYLEVLNKIDEDMELHNKLYYKTLLACMYEGIYKDDYTVLMNLRKSDVREDSVILHDENGAYELTIPEYLAEYLRELAGVDCWIRIHKNGSVYNNATEGCKYADSIFKIIKSKSHNDDKTYRNAYLKRWRDIKTRYLNSAIKPENIYISGIMHRIKEMLEDNNITIDYAFQKNQRDKKVTAIIKNELERCHSDLDVRAFRVKVKGHIEVFKDDDVFMDDNQVKPKEWIIPCNADTYDIRGALKELKIIDWRQTKQLKNAQVGDLFYLYCKQNGQGSIWFKGAILKVNKTEGFIDDSKFSFIPDSYSEEPCIEIAMFREYGITELLTYTKLKEAGLKSKLQGATGVNESLAYYLHKCDDEQRYIDEYAGVKETCLSRFPIIYYELKNSSLDDEENNEELQQIKSLSLDVLKKKAREYESKRPQKYNSDVLKIKRAFYVSEYAKKRAKGICQLCGNPAPFVNPKTGEPYLEAHHIIWLSAGGEDTIDNTVALCPNCHKRMHYLNDFEDVKKLKLVVKYKGV